MKLIIKNKFLSLTGKSTIKGEDGKDVYLVKGSFMNPFKTKKILNLNGEILYVIKNKFWNWMSHTAYIYNPDGELLGSVKKHKYLKYRTFETEGFDSSYKIERELFSLTSNIIKDDNIVATITRPLIAFVDTYELETEDEANLQMYAALTIAVDNIGDEIKKERD